MQHYRVNDFTGGWFIGNFAPSLFVQDDFEVCLKRYVAGDREAEHYQLSAVEYTVVISGRCRIGAQELGPDDICVVPPLESADFEAYTDVVLLAVKTPSIPADKVIGGVDVSDH